MQNFIETVEQNATRLVSHESVLRTLSHRRTIDDKEECHIDLECDEPPDLDIGDGKIFRTRFLDNLFRLVDHEYYSCRLASRGRQKRVCFSIKRIVPVPVVETEQPPKIAPVVKEEPTETPYLIIPFILFVVGCIVLAISILF